MNDFGRQCADGFTESVNHFIQRCKNLIAEAHLAKLLPNLLNRIHFRRIWRNKEQLYVIGYTKRSSFVPRGSITAKQNDVLGILL